MLRAEGRRGAAGVARLALRAGPAIALGLIAATPFTAAAQTRVGWFRDSLPTIPRGVAKVPFGPGEELKYKLKYGIFGVGEARVGIPGIDTVRGRPVYAVQWHIKGGVPGYRIDHWLRSWIDTETLVSRRFINDQKKKNRYREYEIFPEEGRVQRIDHDTTWAIRTSLPLDDIAFVFFARTLPLEVGKTYTFDRYYKDEGNPIILKVLRKDRREVEVGVFNTIVVQPVIRSSSLFEEGGKAEIHFSDDERRLVVYMKVEGPFLPFDFTMHLEEFQPGVLLGTGAGVGAQVGAADDSGLGRVSNPPRIPGPGTPD